MDELERELRALPSGKQVFLGEIAKNGKAPVSEIKEGIITLLAYDPGIGSFDAIKDIFIRGKSGAPIPAMIDKDLGPTTADLKTALEALEASKTSKDPTIIGKVTEGIIQRTKDLLRIIGRIGYVIGDMKRPGRLFDLSKIPQTDQATIKEGINLLVKRTSEQPSKIEIPNAPLMWVHAGRCAWKFGQTAEAVKLCETARRFIPNFGPAWIDLGFLRKGQKDYSGAERAYEKAVEIYQKVAALWISLGTTRLRQGNFDGAEQATEEALKIAPKDTSAYVLLCEIRWAQKDFASIEQVCEDALAIDPRNARLWRNIGAARLAMEDYDGAIQTCERALAIDPKYADVLTLLGTARSLKEDTSGAIEAYEKSLVLDLKNGFAWVNLGEIYEGTGREQEALYCYEQGASWGEKRGLQKAAELYAKEVTPIPPIFLKNK